MSKTTYLAKPVDNQCKWWAANVPEKLFTSNLLEKCSFDYIKKNTSLELFDGSMIIDSEAEHSKQVRGFRVCLGIAYDGKMHWICPTLAMKILIKNKGHADLMVGSGAIAACLRIALYLKRYLNTNDMFNAFMELKQL